jgi:hypothetical protein
LYHGVTSSFFDIGILPVSDLTGQSVFRLVLLVWRVLLFSAKGGLAVSKRGPVPPFTLKKGACAPFSREKGVPAKKMIPKCTDRDFLWYWYGKYQEIPTDTDRKIPIIYTTLKMKHFRQVLDDRCWETWEHGNDPKKVLHNCKKNCTTAI